MNKRQLSILLGVFFLLLIPLIINGMHLTDFQQNPIRLDINNSLNSSDLKIANNITVIFKYSAAENLTFSNITLIGSISAYNASAVAVGHENISEYWAINGVFIKGFRLNNIWYINNPSGLNWLYAVNGVLAPYSCSVIELINNSVVEWQFTSENPFSGGDPLNSSDFWLYLGIFVGVAGLCGIGLFIIFKKGI